jgi:predicted transcriptional regulator
MGLESYAVLKKAGVDFYQFGAIEAAIEAAKCGLKPLVVCVENEASRLISRLEQERINYELKEVSKK